MIMNKCGLYKINFIAKRPLRPVGTSPKYNRQSLVKIQTFLCCIWGMLGGGHRERGKPSQLKVGMNGVRAKRGGGGIPA